MEKGDANYARWIARLSMRMSKNKEEKNPLAKRPPIPSKKNNVPKSNESPQSLKTPGSSEKKKQKKTGHLVLSSICFSPTNQFEFPQIHGHMAERSILRRYYPLPLNNRPPTG
ncbi:hypothetical protein VTN00DRAFT_1146 [Thermoascus crustaceus]|uniref:uncharacterized protein n=1 Tax=Thermoascus crustaceus TaxID=5088 RepID=UPI003744308E